jgi:hypothetical protein
MIVLSVNTDKLEAILSGPVTADQLPCHTSWKERSSTGFTTGRTVINTNNASAVDISGSPASGSQRIIDSITIFNADSVNATVSIQLNAYGTGYTLFRCTLAPGEMLMYTESSGFFVLSNAGSIKTSVNQGSNTIGTALSAVSLGADVVNNNATANSMADITGLSFNVSAGFTYYFRFFIFYTSAATTTGSRWGINGPSSPSMLSFASEYTLTSTTSTRNATVQAYDSPAAANASSVVAMNLAVIEGLIKPSVDGIVIGRFASEIASSAITAKAGSVLYFQQIN